MNYYAGQVSKGEIFKLGRFEKLTGMRIYILYKTSKLECQPMKERMHLQDITIFMNHDF